MFSSANGNQSRNVDGQRHCILVAASNPYPLPTPVYRPQPENLDQSNNIETRPDNRLCDAEALAKSFAQVRTVKVPCANFILKTIFILLAQKDSFFAVCYISVCYLSKEASKT